MATELVEGMQLSVRQPDGSDKVGEVVGTNRRGTTADVEYDDGSIEAITVRKTQFVVLPSTSDDEDEGPDGAAPDDNTGEGSAEEEGDVATTEDEGADDESEDEPLEPRRSGRNAVAIDPTPAEPSAPESGTTTPGESQPELLESTQNARDHSGAQQAGTVPTPAPASTKKAKASKLKAAPAPAATATALPEATEGSEGSAEDDEAADDDNDSEADSEAPEIELDAFSGAIGAVLDSLDAAVSDERAFLRPSAEISVLARAAAKALFDHTADSAAAGGAAAAAAAMLAELHVEGFDAEQIWGQLDMQAGPLLRRAARLLRKVGEEPRFISAEMEEALDEQLNGAQENDEDDPSGDDEDMGNDMLEEGMSGSEEGDDEDEGADRSDDEEDEDAPKKGGHKRKRGAAPAEDEFFRYDDMEKFLQNAEKQRDAEDDEDEDAERDSDEEDSDDEEGGVLGGEDVESGSDAELAAVLENASGLVGRKGRAKRRKMDGEDSDDEDEEEDNKGAMYGDYFDSDAESDMAEDDAEVEGAAGGSPEDGEDWDGQEMYDTGEGRTGAEAVSGSEGEDDAASEGDDEGGDDEEGGAEGTVAAQSKHERRQARMRARIAALEEANMGDKDWFMRGEAKGDVRPLNSALELDLDFERTLKPPPQPTEEATASLEDLIRARIADAKWDDVPRVAPPPPDKRRTQLELDDNKNAKGLGELYEEEYQAAAGNVAEDKEEPLRAEAKALLKGLFLKLDSLSHFSFAPKPIVEDMTVRADVPALAMEEVAPQVASEAAMRYPEEVYKSERKSGAAPTAETELSREERRRRRAGKKSSAKKHRAQKDSDKRTKILSAGGESGRKSEAAAAAAAAEAKSKGGKKKSGTRSEYTQSTKVFAKLQDAADAAAAGKLLPAKKRVELKGTPSGLKL